MAVSYNMSVLFSIFLYLIGLVTIASLPITLVDLTYEFSKKTPTFVTHSKFESRDLKLIYPDPNSTIIRFAVQDFFGSEHAGTHMDAPIHFHDGGLTMEQIPIEHFTGPAVVIDIKERARHDSNTSVTVEDLENWEQKYGRIPDNAFVLMNSGWDKFWEDEKKYLGNDRRDVTDLHFPAFSIEACKWLAENRQIYGGGVDTAGLDLGTTTTYPCHNLWLPMNKIILENVYNVDQLPPVGATLRAYPMKIKGGTGAPTRIIATFNTARTATDDSKNEL